MIKLWKFFLAILIVCFGANVSAAEKNTVVIGSMGWEDLMPMSLITKKYLEQEGYKVEIKTFSEWGIAFSAVSRGDVDVLISHINYNTYDYWQKNKERLEKLSAVSYGLKQGLVVPDYVSITSIDQLNSIKGQVGGKIIGLEPGAGVMRELNNAVKAYGLDYQVVEGSTTAMVAQLQSNIERKQPTVTILWTPSWMIQKFKVKYLEDPKHIFSPPQAYYWIAKKGFAAENPRLREVLASEFISIDDITRLNSAVNDGKTMDQAVDDWWRQNTTLVSRWATLASK